MSVRFAWPRAAAVALLSLFLAAPAAAEPVTVRATIVQDAETDRLGSGFLLLVRSYLDGSPHG